MKKRRLIWQIYPSFLLIVFSCLFVPGWYFLRSFRDFHYSQVQAELYSAANMLAKYLESAVVALEPGVTDPVCNLFGHSSGYRFTVILPSGKVIGDSEKKISEMDNHADRPEIMRAFKGLIGADKRYSRTLRMDMFYVAVPLSVNDEIACIVRASLPLEKIDMTMDIMWHRLTVAALIMAVLAVFATILATRGVSGQLAGISSRAASFGQGELGDKLPSYPILEIDVLASNMNRMADQLNDRIITVMEQRDEQNVLLSCMIESVLAVDNEKNVIRMNKAARELFGVNVRDVRGKSITEIIRDADLLEIIEKTLESSGIVEDEVFLGVTNLYLQVHGSILRGNDGKRIGVLIVLNDITRIHKLEIMRKDFVANVSHELKTPITSIKGFIDTLIDNPVSKKADRDHFMQIIHQQADRLQTIIDDLLALSTLEHDIEEREIVLQSAQLDQVLKNAVQTCSGQAAAKNIHVKLMSDSSIKADVNVQLLEQAVVNLIDNAIKYSEPDTLIDVRLGATQEEIVIDVCDHGVGISEKHLARIFERFYRVDKSRSRKMGGTGLGLAIVKHVAIAHKGRVEVRSEPGNGSVFSIFLPR